MNQISSPFSPQKNRLDYDRAPMTYASPGQMGRELVGDSLWLSKKMIDDGCTLEQTLQIMEERCKNCNTLSPMSCVEQCKTWEIKRELRETNRVISEDDHGLKLLNAIKNRRRLTILELLYERPMSLCDLQEKLRSQKFYHSQETINDYLKPLFDAGLVKESDNRLGLTLYGRRIHDTVVKHGFNGQLPVHSGGHEERILRSLIDGAKTRSELQNIVPSRSLSRTLKRLHDLKLIVNNSPSDLVFYFCTKRSPSLEKLSPTQRKIFDAIPQAGIPARELAKAANINLRRVYKYLRNLRGKKLVFRREMLITYELTETGKATAEFLEDVAGIQ